MIIAADIHLRQDKPLARIDDYWQAQSEKFSFILELARKSPPLVIAGDFFNRARPPIPLIRWVMDKLIEYDVVPLVIAGQHDLPYHSISNINSSGIGLLQASGLLDILNYKEPYCDIISGFNFFGYSFGETPTNKIDSKDNVLVWHHMVISNALWKGQVADKANSILKKYSKFKLILTGDNHQTFAIAETVDKKSTSSSRFLINAGSMMRLSIDQEGHKPCVFEYDGGRITQHFLPIKGNVFDLNLVNDHEERKQRISSFIKQLNTDFEIDINFERNLIDFLKKEKINKEVADIILVECLNE